MPPLNEVVERCIMEFLPVVPDRLRIEAVCRRWRLLSHEEVPVTELDFGQVVMRPLLRCDVSAMLERANNQLTRLVLPDITLVDAHIELIVQQRNLRVFRAHRCVDVVAVAGDHFLHDVQMLSFLIATVGAKDAEEAHLQHLEALPQFEGRYMYCSAMCCGWLRFGSLTRTCTCADFGAAGLPGLDIERVATRCGGAA